MSERSAPAAPVWGRALLVATTLALALVVVVGLLAAPASAHVELVESDPLNVATVAEPVREVRLTFSAAADPVEGRFAIEGPAGPVEIAAIANEGDEVLVVTPSTPLAAGRQRLTWAIRSGDSHTMTGAVAFTVTGAGSGATALDTDPSAAGVDEDPASNGPTGAPAVAEHLATIGRWLVYGAALVCVGGLGHLAFVHLGTAGEGRLLVFLVRRAAIVVAAATLVEAAAQVVVREGGVWSALAPGAWIDLAATSFGTGTGLRLLGAALVLGGLRMDLRAARIDVVGAERGDDGLGLDAAPGRAVTAPVAPLVRLRVEASPLAALGAALLVVSEAFLGHTATEDPRVVVLVGDAAHLVAAALWGAGAALLAWTLRRRQRAHQPLDARLLAARFSVVASWSAAVVGLTGAALAASILELPSGLWATDLGRVLLAKVVVVAVIGAIGLHNHRHLVPLLQVGEDDGGEVGRRFRVAISAEALLFVVVLALTAVLVASDPT